MLGVLSGVPLLLHLDCWCAIGPAKSSLYLVCHQVYPSTAVTPSWELCAANHQQLSDGQAAILVMCSELLVTCEGLDLGLYCVVN